MIAACVIAIEDSDLRLFDIARSAYVKSPAGLRRSIAPVISMVPVSVRYGPVYRRWRADIAHARTDTAFSNMCTERALRALLSKAHGASAHHAARIDAAFAGRFDAGAMRVEDLPRLPISTKSSLTAAGAAALTDLPKRLVRNCTSGSNGEKPFAFYVDKDRSVREYAFVTDAWSRTGYRESDARVVLKGFKMKGAEDRLFEWEPALGELRLCVFPMTEADVDLYMNLIEARGIRFIHGYPSAIEVFCRHMLRLGRRFGHRIDGVLPISEPLYDHQRGLIRRALGDVSFAPFYGLSEKALFASEVPGQDNVYEVEPLYGLGELLDEDDRPVTEPGREGRLVGTGFISSGMPFIRYDTQDRATLVRAGTRENGWRMRISSIMPRRKPSYFIGATGKRIVATNFPPQDPDFFSGISEFQFYQDEPGKSVIRYLPTPGGTAEDAERVRAALERKADGFLTFSIEKVEQLANGLQGKRAFIDQRLDVSRY